MFYTNKILLLEWWRKIHLSHLEYPWQIVQTGQNVTAHEDWRNKFKAVHHHGEAPRSGIMPLLALMKQTAEDGIDVPP